MNCRWFGIRNCRALSENGMCIFARIAGLYWERHIVRDFGWVDSGGLLSQIVLDYLAGPDLIINRIGSQFT